MWRHIPEPLEWHPFYAGKTYLLDWLEGHDQRMPYDTIQIAVPKRLKLWEPKQELPGPEDSCVRLTMTRERCWGLAPYVGPPFVYVWNFGVDNLGRMIAGDARIQYID